LNLLIDEQQLHEPNPLYALSWEAHQMQPRHSSTVGTSGCIHRYFAVESVVCDDDETERIAVDVALEVSSEQLYCTFSPTTITNN
jgi:hypothetical protein